MPAATGSGVVAASASTPAPRLSRRGVRQVLAQPALLRGPDLVGPRLGLRRPALPYYPRYRYARPYYYYNYYYPVPSYYGYYSYSEPNYYPVAPAPAVAPVEAAPAVVAAAPRRELPRFGIGLFAGGVSVENVSESTDVGALGRFRLTSGLLIEGEIGKTSYDKGRTDRRSAPRSSTRSARTTGSPRTSSRASARSRRTSTTAPRRPRTSARSASASAWPSPRTSTSCSTSAPAAARFGLQRRALRGRPDSGEPAVRGQQRERGVHARSSGRRADL